MAMKKPAASLATIAILLLAILTLVKTGGRFELFVGDAAPQPRESAANPKAHGGETPAQSRKRQKRPMNLDLQDLEKEFDEILPAQFPDQPSSLCDAELKPGETLVLGGFGSGDGGYEFTAIQAEMSVSDTGSTGFILRLKSFTMGRDASHEIGLESLISPAKTRIQKSVVFPPGESPWMDAASSVILAPMVAMDAGTPATINMGTKEQARVYSLIANPIGDDGSLRLRTRIENPGDAQDAKAARLRMPSSR